MLKRKEMEPPPKPSVPSTHACGMASNRLLAGYMAHEFLTKGTLFGEKFETARFAGMVRQPSSGASSPTRKSEPQCYAEVAKLLKSDESHVPGVVNPTQLARWILM